MNPDFSQPSREELEVKITTLLLGELEADEAARVRDRISREADLARLYRELERTLVLVREAVNRPAEPSPAAVLPRMTEGRRAALLARLGSGSGSGAGAGSGAEGEGSGVGEVRVVPVEFGEEASGVGRRGGSGMWLALAACLIALLGATSVWLANPGLSGLPASSRMASAETSPRVTGAEGMVRQTLTSAPAAEVDLLRQEPAAPAPHLYYANSGREGGGDSFGYTLSDAGKAPVPPPTAAPPAPAAGAMVVSGPVARTAVASDKAAPVPFQMSPELMKRYGLVPSRTPARANAAGSGDPGSPSVSTAGQAPETTPLGTQFFAEGLGGGGFGGGGGGGGAGGGGGPALPGLEAQRQLGGVPGAAVSSFGRVVAEDPAVRESLALNLEGRDANSQPRFDVPSSGEVAAEDSRRSAVGGAATDLYDRSGPREANAGKPTSFGAMVTTSPVAGLRGPAESAPKPDSPANAPVLGDRVELGALFGNSVASTPMPAPAGPPSAVAAEAAGLRSATPTDRSSNRYRGTTPERARGGVAELSDEMAVAKAEPAPSGTAGRAGRAGVAQGLARGVERVETGSREASAHDWAMRGFWSESDLDANGTGAKGGAALAGDVLARKSRGLGVLDSEAEGLGERDLSRLGKELEGRVEERKQVEWDVSARFAKDALAEVAEVDAPVALERRAKAKAAIQADSGVAAGEDFGVRTDEKKARTLAENVGRLEAVNGIALAVRPASEPVLAPPTEPVAPVAPEPQPEVATAENPFSTFSLNVSDVSFKLAGASLDQGQWPSPATVRAEEFLNAFQYRDPEPTAGVPVGFAWERARYPFAHQRDMVRFAVRTAARGRETGRPLNLVLLVDNSGSMERADRELILREAMRSLAAQLKAGDRVSLITFARGTRLWLDALPGDQAAELVRMTTDLVPEGGTNLEEALRGAYATALKHFLPQGVNRVVLLTDGAANLGDTRPETLKRTVEEHRQRGVALDCFGIGWEGYNDDLLETLARHGDGRYGFVNAPEEAATEFAGQLAGALQVAASDVKVQVEFNPRRVTAWRQIGYAKHQLTKEQFRDNTVDAAELGAAETGNALYAVEIQAQGDGPLATVRVRYKVPESGAYEEHEWVVPYTGAAPALEQSSPAMRLATTSAAFAEWLGSSPYAAEVKAGALLNYLSGVPAAFAPDPRPGRLEGMIVSARAIRGE